MRALTEVLDRPDDPTAEAAALAELPLARQLVSLLRWPEPVREVTESNEPRQQDLPAEAAAVGVTMDQAQLPTTTADVPRLWAMWIALDMVDLIGHGVGRVFTPVESDVLAGDAPVPHQQLLDAVQAAIDELLQDAADDDQLDDGALEALLFHAPPSARAVAALPLLGAAATGEEA